MCVDRLAFFVEFHRAPSRRKNPNVKTKPRKKIVVAISFALRWTIIIIIICNVCRFLQGANGSLEEKAENNFDMYKTFKWLCFLPPLLLWCCVYSPYNTIITHHIHVICERLRKHASTCYCQQIGVYVCVCLFGIFSFLCARGGDFRSTQITHENHQNRWNRCWTKKKL